VLRRLSRGRTSHFHGCGLASSVRLAGSLGVAAHSSRRPIEESEADDVEHRMAALTYHVALALKRSEDADETLAEIVSHSTFSRLTVATYKHWNNDELRA
jgi:hypothetical protein